MGSNGMHSAERIPIRRLVSIQAAAAYLGVCDETVRNRITDGLITGHRLGPRLIRVDLNEIDDNLLPEVQR